MLGDDKTLEASPDDLIAGPPAIVRAVDPHADTMAAQRADGDASQETFPVQNWDRYAFVRMLGQGGMGTVFEAIDKRLDRKVALKFIRGGNQELATRFLREARAQARIEHENVCKVFEVGEIDGKAYIAMQFVAGQTLDKASVFMTVDEKVIVMRDVATALHAAHTLGILHRDIKPANILIEMTQDGRYKPIVMDFGLAREENENKGMTESGVIVGTPAYMSPEQAQGSRTIDRRSDVYSVGATLYEALAGQAPFQGETPMNIMVAVLSEEPTPLRSIVPSIPLDLVTITVKCLHKSPGERYESARALAEDLDRYLRGEPILGRRESIYRQLRRWGSKHRAIVAMALVSVMIVGVAGGFALESRLQANREKIELQRQATIEREIGQSLEEIEWLVRTAYILPQHDVTTERAMVKERMKQLEARGNAGGPIEALVDYALGRGHLALGEDDEAYRRLTHAKKRGIDSPELHYALGLVLGRRYDRALREAQQSGGIDTKEIEEQYLRPTLESMEKSRGAHFKSQSYMDGLLAYYKKDYDTALRHAKKAIAELPWLYEAIELQAGIHLTRGIERLGRGDFDVAVESIKEASRLFDVAAQFGRSDARIYEASAEALRWQLSVATRDESIDDLVREILDKANTALAIDPSRVGPYVVIIDAYQRMNERLLSFNKDNRSTLEAQIAAGEKAVAIAGKSQELCLRMAGAYSSFADYLTFHGLDAGKSLEDYLAMSRCAWESTSTTNDLDFVGWTAQSKTHRDTLLMHLLNAYHARASWFVLHGKDPAPSMQAAFETAAERLRTDPRNAIALRYLGKFHALTAQYRLLAGQNAREPLEEASRKLEESLAATTTANAHAGLLEVHLLRVENALDRGENPQSALDTAAKELDEYREKFTMDEGWTLFRLRYHVLSHRSVPTAERAALLREAVAQAQEVTKKDGSRLDWLLDICEWLAEAARRLALAEPHETRKYLDMGLAATDHGLAINPKHARLLMRLGALRLLEAQTSSGKAQTDIAQKAREALEKAKIVNPLLEREIKQLLTQAKQVDL